MSDNTKRIIDINGVKVEIDLREATVQSVDKIQVGTPCKVLVKGYSDSSVYSGVVFDFLPFKDKPTIRIAYFQENWSSFEIKFVDFNADTKDSHQIVFGGEPNDLDRSKIGEWFDAQAAKKKLEIEELALKRRFFEDKFKLYWKQAVPAADAPVEA